MKKIIFLVALSKLFVVVSFAQQLNINWSVSGGGSGDEIVQNICQTTNNNFLAAGNFTGSFEINGVTYNSVNNGQDIFIIKYNQAHTIEWSKVIGNACIDQLTGITSDALGNIYITGSFYNSISIDLTTVMSAGSQDIFIASLDENGNLNWIQSYGGVGSDEGKSIVAAPDGSVILAASMNASSFPFDDQVSVGGSAHIIKFTNSGTILWSICESGDVLSDIEIEDMVVGSEGTIFTTGNFIGNVLAGDNGIITMQSDLSTMWVGSYSSLGATNYIYAPQPGLGNNNGGTGIALSPSGTPVVAGFSSGYITIGDNSYQSNENDLMIFELNENGIPMWSSVIVAPGYQKSNKMAIDPNGAIGVTGLFLGDFNVGSLSCVNSGGTDGFFALVESGTLTSLTAFSSIGNDNALSVTATADEFIVTGNFSGGIVSSMNAGTDTLQSAGGNDFFITSVEKSQTLGIASVAKQNSLKAYPNPASSFINFTGDFENETVTVSIYSVSGKLELSSEVQLGFDSAISVDIQNLASGNYIAGIESGNQKFTSKFVKD